MINLIGIFHFIVHIYIFGRLGRDLIFTFVVLWFQFKFNGFTWILRLKKRFPFFIYMGRWIYLLFICDYNHLGVIELMFDSFRYYWDIMKDDSMTL